MKSASAAADLRPVEGPVADPELAQLAKALGHPARVSILRLLRRSGTQTVGELVRVLSLAQSTVSEHLRVLRESGLVHQEERGAYALDIHRVRRLKALVGSL